MTMKKQLSKNKTLTFLYRIKIQKLANNLTEALKPDKVKKSEFGALLV